MEFAVLPTDIQREAMIYCKMQRKCKQCDASFPRPADVGITANILQYEIFTSWGADPEYSMPHVFLPTTLISLVTNVVVAEFGPGRM